MPFSREEFEEFKAEALELLDQAEKSLLALDGGAEFRSSFDTIFRGFHNLKGAAGMMELPKLQSHTHELESILMGFKEKSGIPKEHLNLFLRGIDAARSILDGNEVAFSFAVGSAAVEPPAPAAVVPPPPPTETARTPPGPLDPAAHEFLAECEEIVERVSESLQLLEKGRHSKGSIDALYRDVHSLKGAAYLFSYSDLGDIAHAMESSLEGVRAGTRKATGPELNALFRCLEIAETLVANIRDTKSSPQQREEVRMAIDTLSRATDGAASPPPAPEPSSALSAQAANAPESAGGSPKDKEQELSSVRVPVALLDNLMTLMGEMVLVRNQVLQHSSKSEDPELVNMSKRLNLVTSEIQGEMMKTRMQPVGNILNKFNRVVRDLSIELKKKITLNLSGADTEIDKSLLEAIKDPLTHIVRNSCDHGIESPDQRTQSGKPEAGTINIRAYHEGGQVIIEVSDDGKGLHRDVLLKKAVEKGLLSDQQAGKLTEKEVFNLIFAPGFSTAAKITNVSGRGVGMDVVRTNVERIGGFIDLSSVAGKGTSIKLKIPLTLAIIPALIVKCGEGTFAIPQVKLEELVRVDQSTDENKIELLHGVPVYRLRGNILPLVDLNGLLKVKGGGKTCFDSSTFNIAVLSAETSSFGLIIDEIKDTADIVVKPINRLLKSLQIYSGATILGDGSIALILDVNGISKAVGIRNLERDAEKAGAGAKSGKALERQDFLLVRLNSPTKHAIVLGYVHRMEEFKRSALEYSGNQPVIRYRDIILPLISANKFLGYDEKPSQRESLPVVVIQKRGELYGLLVEEIVDTLSTTADLSTSFSRHPGILGNLNTKDELVVAVDPFELIEQAFPAGERSFAITGPAASSTVETPDSLNTPAGASADAPTRVLVVEDTVFFRKALKAILEKGGFEVATAADGEEALEVLSAGKTDVIVSDIEMPKMNGFQLAMAVRKNPALSSLPMLAVSSRADPKYMKAGAKAGFDAYLEKLRPALLLESVNALLKKGRNAA